MTKRKPSQPASVVGATAFRRSSASSEVRFLREIIDGMNQRLTALEAKATAAPMLVEGRIRDDVDDAVAKREVGDYFTAHDGETIYPSEIASALGLDYESVIGVITELERDGQVAKV